MLASVAAHFFIIKGSITQPLKKNTSLLMTGKG